MIYLKEDIKKRLEDYRTKAADELHAWQQVRRQYTTSGKEFKTLSKNFTNCTIKAGQTSLLGPEITVYFYSKYGGHQSSGLDITISSQDLPATDPRYKKTSGCVYVHYPLSVEEIAAKIEAEKLRLKNHIKELDDQVKNLDIFIVKADKILQEINTLFKDKRLHDIDREKRISFYKNSLGWAIKEYIENNIK